MTTTTKGRARKGGLDWTVPDSGSAADAYQVACTAILLGENAPDGQPWPRFQLARHATRLHVISGRLWILAERKANGYHDQGQRVMDARRKASLEADAMEIASHYGLSCSFGGLVDGGLVIGTPDQLAKVDPERHGHVIRRLGR